jgi:hypothetical protein
MGVAVVIQPQHPELLPDETVNPEAAADLLTGQNHAFQLFTKSIKSIVKIGGNSIFNNQVYQAY